MKPWVWYQVDATISTPICSWLTSWNSISYQTYMVAFLYHGGRIPGLRYLSEPSSVVDPGFGKGGFMRMRTVAITPTFDAHAHRCIESGCCCFNGLYLQRNCKSFAKYTSQKEVSMDTPLDTPLLFILTGHLHAHLVHSPAGNGRQQSPDWTSGCHWTGWPQKWIQILGRRWNLRRDGMHAPNRMH